MSRISTLHAVARPVTALPSGTWMIMFGTVVELVTVAPEPHPAFPGARLLTIRPVITSGDPLCVLVPIDYVPVALTPPRGALTE